MSTCPECGMQIEPHEVAWVSVFDAKARHDGCHKAHMRDAGKTYGTEDTRPAGAGRALSAAPAIGDIDSSLKGSGARFNAGKAPLDMIPLHLLEGAARVFHQATTRAVNPYPKWNWAKGMPWSVVIGCIKRHLAALERGEDRDPDSGELHIDHVMCNVLMLTHFYQAYPEGDDRCEYFKTGEPK